MKRCYESYATKLEKENARLRAELEAAKADLMFVCGSRPYTDASICDICAHRQEDGSCPRQCFMNTLFATDNRWEWRGTCAENGCAK
jgi:hypothetical protein